MLANLDILQGRGLQSLEIELLTSRLQVSENNPIVGLGHRVNLLRDLGKSLLAQPQVFGAEGRPGNIVGA